MNITTPPVCYNCARFNKTNLTCKAFSERIPDSIFDGGDPHTSPVAGDHNILFKKKGKNHVQQTLRKHT